MNSIDPFFGAQILVYSEQPSWTDACVAQLELHSWETITTENLKSVDPTTPSIILVALVPASSIGSFLDSVGFIKIDPNRILLVTDSKLGIPENISTFTLSTSVGPHGEHIDLRGLAASLLKMKKNIFNSLLESQIRTLSEAGTISLISRISSVPVGTIKERAHLVFALSSDMNCSVSVVKRAVKYAVLEPISKIENIERIVSESRVFWDIREILEPENYSLEKALCKTALIFQKDSGQFSTFLENVRLELLSFDIETRSSILASCERCLKSLLEYSDVA